MATRSQAPQFKHRGRLHAQLSTIREGNSKRRFSASKAVYREASPTRKGSKNSSYSRESTTATTLQTSSMNRSRSPTGTLRDSTEYVNLLSSGDYGSGGLTGIVPGISYGRIDDSNTNALYSGSNRRKNGLKPNAARSRHAGEAIVQNANHSKQKSSKNGTGTLNISVKPANTSIDNSQGMITKSSKPTSGMSTARTADTAASSLNSSMVNQKATLPRKHPRIVEKIQRKQSDGRRSPESVKNFTQTATAILDSGKSSTKQLESPLGSQGGTSVVSHAGGGTGATGGKDTAEGRKNSDELSSSEEFRSELLTSATRNPEPNLQRKNSKTSEDIVEEDKVNIDINRDDISAAQTSLITPRDLRLDGLTPECKSKEVEEMKEIIEEATQERITSEIDQSFEKKVVSSEQFEPNGSISRDFKDLMDADGSISLRYDRFSDSQFDRPLSLSDRESRAVSISVSRPISDSQSSGGGLSISHHNHSRRATFCGPNSTGFNTFLHPHITSDGRGSAHSHGSGKRHTIPAKHSWDEKSDKSMEDSSGMSKILSDTLNDTSLRSQNTNEPNRNAITFLNESSLCIQGSFDSGEKVPSIFELVNVDPHIDPMIKSRFTKENFHDNKVSILQRLKSIKKENRTTEGQESLWSIETEESEEEIDTQRQYFPTRLLPGGVKYEGDWLGNMKDGYGVEIYEDGSRYMGEWRSNQYHGKGQYFYANGDFHSGDYRYSKPHGNGVFQRFKGVKYEGSFKNGFQDGNGQESWPDGTQFEGSFKCGKKEGYGVYRFSNGSIYRGNWRNDQMSGRGMIRYLDGREYDGSWVSNQKHGYGSLLYPDGGEYAGEFANDKRQGRGRFRWPSGAVYEGDWVHDRPHGMGTHASPNGDVKEGLWVRGKAKKRSKSARVHQRHRSLSAAAPLKQDEPRSSVTD